MAAKKILVVDDEHPIRRLLKASLGIHYTILEAENGGEALRIQRKAAGDGESEKSKPFEDFLNLGGQALGKLGQGAQAEITGQIQSIGSNLIFVFERKMDWQMIGLSVMRILSHSIHV